MKNRLITLLALAGISPLSFGELDLPQSVFRVEQMEEAKGKDVENEKPLIVVFTNPGTT
ncbi:MAG: hypothetical protein OSB65_06095 [Roseibacillus sp.]|nr:hypothetical protein [Roseibacillus sp.]